MLARLEALEHLAISRVEPEKARACQEIEFDSVPVYDMDTRSGAAEEAD